jgi:hypothetical protein
MRILPRHLRKECYNYQFDYNIEEVKQKMRSTFSKKTFDFSTNLVGQFISEDEFIINEKSFGIGKAIASSVYTNIRGKFNQDNNRTILNVSVKPSPNFYFFWFAFILVGIIPLKSAYDNPSDNRLKLLIEFISISIIIPILIAIYAQVSKVNLRENFVKTFNLKKET